MSNVGEDEREAAVALYEAGEYDESISTSRAAYERDSSLTFILPNIGHALLAKGRPDEAAPWYDAALRRRNPSDHVETIRELRELLERHPEAERAREFLGPVRGARSNARGVGRCVAPAGSRAPGLKHRTEVSGDLAGRLNRRTSLWAVRARTPTSWV